MPIEIISTDFDGTLVIDGESPPFVPELAHTIESLRSEGAVWAVNTGRSLWHLVEGLRRAKFPFPPDYVLTSEREIYRQSDDHSNHDGWEDFGEWNARCVSDHSSLYRDAEGFFEEIGTVAREHQAQVVRSGRIVEGLIAATEEEMDMMLTRIDALRTDQPKVSYQRNSIYLRFCHVDYHKGSALGELARLLDIDPGNIFAAGDNYNDLSMLDGEFAGMPACPSNSVEAVKEQVRAANGYVAHGIASQGVDEALKYFRATPQA